MGIVVHTYVRTSHAYIEATEGLLNIFINLFARTLDNRWPRRSHSSRSVDPHLATLFRPF